MSAINQSQTFYIELESNLNTSWPDGIYVFTKDTEKLWILKNGTYVQASGGVGGSGSTSVQPGSNILTGGTPAVPIVSLTPSPSINGLSFSGSAIGNIFSANTISGGTIYSGSTNLYSIFLQTAYSGAGSSTYVQPGTNISTGGTPSSPIINLINSPSIDGLSFSGSAIGNALSANTISGGTIFSGSTDLSYIFTSTAQTNSIIAQLNTKVDITGTTFDARFATKANLSGATFTGAIISGSTDLYGIFLQTAYSGAGSSTYVQPGSNITTGGTPTSPIVNLVSSPSINGLSFSGSAIGLNLSATTLSGGTIYSGTTNIETIYLLKTGTNRITVGTTAPSSPATGDIWIDTN